jgi:hypothetical protein
MNRLLPLAAAAAAAVFLGACGGSGGGCSSPPPEKSGQAAPMASGGTSHGGLGEPVSFQGLGRKPPPPQQKAAAPAQSSSGPSSAPGATSSGAGATESLLCAGFPDLPKDCSKAPQFKAIKAKCCPSGTVERCEAIPGGARLYGKGCR